tara:strand:- start:1419 stop:2411 length:993 start_codon:yes stop_codon:yes gene_type:complete
MPDFTQLMGWKENRQGVEACVNDPANKHPIFSLANHKIRNENLKDTHLWLPLLWCNPNYRRGAQGIGDCVSWGAELAATILTAKICYKRRAKGRFMEAATEPLYGGGRVEAEGISFGGWSDGSYGGAQAKFMRDWGILYRMNYSDKTGNPDHNLGEYSSRKAKNWGAYGCGGKNDGGKLDTIARDHPVKTTSLCRGFDDCARSIAVSKCPVTIASNYGCSMRRNNYGECRWNQRWPHQMVLIAVRFGSRPGCLCAQSWGPEVASGPSGDKYTDNLPGPTPRNILGFTWWIPADDIDRICREEDTWAIGDVDGWRPDRFKWDRLWDFANAL